MDGTDGFRLRDGTNLAARMAALHDNARTFYVAYPGDTRTPILYTANRAAAIAYAAVHNGNWGRWAR
jgi:hypothetical protein